MSLNRPHWIPAWLAAFASLVATEGQAERAARLFGAAEALHNGTLPENDQR